MGFNWLYVNPISYPGFSGSLYAIKDYFQLNPHFFPASLHNSAQSLVSLRNTLGQIVDLGLHPIADLVINHTSIDSPLIQDHPNWFCWEGKGLLQHPYAIDPSAPDKKTVWGDLAVVNNQHSPDRDALRAFWLQVMKAYIQVGFEGFRCDAAYQVPVELWRYLIDFAKEINPNVIFWAKNLGCTPEQTRALRGAGFHFFCNSSKWWNFKDAWCLEQHQEFEDLPSISFPETHDTDRLSKENQGSEPIQRQRYAFAAIFSAGIMMPIGYEFGFQKKLDVVKTRPNDWELPLYDLSKFIACINSLKSNWSILSREGSIQKMPSENPDVLILSRQSHSVRGENVLILINTHAKWKQRVSTASLLVELESFRLVHFTKVDQNMKLIPCLKEVTLEPAEALLIVHSTAAVLCTLGALNNSKDSR